MRASEAIDFAREVRAPRNLAIHDRVYSEAGLGIVDGHMNAFLPKAGRSTSGSPTARTSPASGPLDRGHIVVDPKHQVLRINHADQTAGISRHLVA